MRTAVPCLAVEAGHPPTRGHTEARGIDGLRYSAFDSYRTTDARVNPVGVESKLGGLRARINVSGEMHVECVANGAEFIRTRRRGGTAILGQACPESIPIQRVCPKPIDTVVDIATNPAIDATADA